MKTTSTSDSGAVPSEAAGNEFWPDIPEDFRRRLSHDLRTPLSAMAGWIHLIESGTLDPAGLKRAAAKLQSNIEEQVRTIEKYLGHGEGRH